MTTRRHKTIQKGLKDYLVPIIGFILIFILIFSFFGGNKDNTPSIDLENKIGMNLSLDSSSSESYIIYPGDFKKQIEGNTSLYKGEKVIVKNGNVSLSLAGVGDFKVNKLGEFKYKENGDFALYSSDLWLNSISSLEVDLRYASVKVGENTTISFSQNEMSSTIYLLKGFATVSNLIGESTVLADGQKITISRSDASKKDIDFSLQKNNIDDYYKQSDWFIVNNGSSFLNLNNEDLENTSTGKIKTSTNNIANLISFSNLSDESYVSSNLINISGNILNEEVTKITLNGKEAKINKGLQTFTFDKVPVSNKENDLVFKIYDDANDLLSKFIYTIFYEGATSSKSSKFNVQTFKVDGSQFQFTTIKDKVTKPLNGKTTYITYGDFLTLYGKVSIEGISSVSVNGYTLKSFNGNTWRYHPSTINNNLSDGTNVYEVKYFDKKGDLIYTNHFTIIKKNNKIDVFSDEVKIN